MDDDSETITMTREHAEHLVAAGDLLVALRSDVQDGAAITLADLDDMLADWGLGAFVQPFVQPEGAADGELEFVLSETLVEAVEQVAEALGHGDDSEAADGDIEDDVAGAEDGFSRPPSPP